MGCGNNDVIGDGTTDGGEDVDAASPRIHASHVWDYCNSLWLCLGDTVTLAGGVGVSVNKNTVE